jgi:hypothetical protein
MCLKVELVKEIKGRRKEGEKEQIIVKYITSV